MKHNIKVILTGTLLAFFALAGSVQAQTKIGTVDLRKVFDNYYKTKQADAALKDEAADLEKELKGIVEGYNKREEEYKTLVDKANDQAVSAEERAKSKKAADSKFAELKDTEKAVRDFQGSARAKIGEKQRIKRDKILTEIRDVVATKAKAAGYQLVVDTAGESASSAPLVLYSSGENDITEAILTQLNSTAPPTTTKPDEKKTDDKKSDQKPETKPKK